MEGRLSCFIVLAIYLAAASAFPNGNQNQQIIKCRLTDLIAESGYPVSVPEVDLDEVDNTVLPDPLIIPNDTSTYNEPFVKGTYSFWNGKVKGLSTLKVDVGDASYSGFSIRASIERLALTADYEIIGGEVNLTTAGFGVHTFSGKGPLAASISGANASFSITIKMDDVTKYISVADLKLDFEFANASIVVENLIVDGVPVNWDEINQSIRPRFEALWVNDHDAKVERLQQEINDVLTGCTLMDIVQLLAPPQPQQ